MKLCPVCNARKAKRTCPALGKQICTVCCGTKRIVEINCPPDCGYLASSRTHPPAVVQRQHELDRAMLLPLLQGLSERQARIFLLLASVTARHQGDVLQRLVDEDIGQAAGALAATLETSGRGIVYEHRPASLAAARLMSELKALVEDAAKNAGTVIERDAAIALRRIEHAAKMMTTVKPNENELQEMFKRILGPAAAGEPPESTAPQAPSVIIP
jgi:hypothetical protein